MRGHMGDLMPYRGYKIDLTSYEVPEPDGWVARAELTRTSIEQGEESRTVGVADPQFTRFATKEQADELALKIARAWVDGKLGPEPSA
jgi:hypothetical protein